ncbi:hypothetical protein [Adlercreutzia muris]|uniref:hypothetical protein n=1 Tax=Adlercreutzia muris TaxID=1796610 RepID=UPI0013667C20|nr:hypothetical protein [Adlercreutzia muris]NCA32118.1 hypothetical protein [Adlercreutzia muris]
MIGASEHFRQLSAEDPGIKLRAVLVLASGETVALAGEDIARGSASFVQSTSAAGSFDIGAAIAGSLSLKLENQDGKFDALDFSGARILPSVGIELPSGGEEWVRRGTYWVDQPSAYGGTISLTGADSMCKLDVPYDGVGTRYPATAGTVVRDLCSHCGVPLADARFAGHGTVFKTRPEGATCRQVLSWAAQATCNWARMTNEGLLELDWYDPSAFDGEDWLDGEEFDDGSPYQSGSRADGGTFDSYGSGATADGGTFDNGKIVSIWAYSSATVMTDDVEITGIRVTASDEVLADGGAGREGETALAGAEGYVLDISGNPLIAFGEAGAAAARIAGRAVGLRFRPFDASAIAGPLVEPGDACVVTDRKQNAHRSYITGVTYKLGAYAALSCSAEPPLRNGSGGGGAATRALKGALDAVRKERTARETALRQLNDELAAAPGMYVTQKTEGGGTTWYLHDKADLADSKIVWKVNAAGFGMSMDGGKTYAYGLDKWGNAILNTIYAVGIDADYIDAGALRVRSGGKTVMCADVRTGQFWWDALYSSLNERGELEVTKGKIGGLTLANGALYSGRPSLESSSDGTYLGTDGVSTSGRLYGGASRYRTWNALSKGFIYGGIHDMAGGSNRETGYVSFAWDSLAPGTGNPVVVAGRDSIVLASPKLYVGSYINRNPNGGSGASRLVKGETRDVFVHTSARQVGTKVYHYGVTLEFTNGLLTDVK